MLKLLYHIEHDVSPRSAISTFLSFTSASDVNLNIKVYPNLISVENIDEFYISKITTLINEYFHITSMDIYSESGCQKLDYEDIKTMLSASSSIDDYHVLLSKLERTIDWALTRKDAKFKLIEDLVYSDIQLLSIEYSKHPKILDVKVGDIVQAIFAFNLSGETRGQRVPAIVCNIDNDIAFLVPIIRKDYAIKKLSSDFLIPIDMAEDIISSSYPYTTESVAQLRRGRSIRIGRITKIFGKASESFMEKILSELPKAFDFRNN